MVLSGFPRVSNGLNVKHNIRIVIDTLHLPFRVSSCLYVFG